MISELFGDWDPMDAQMMAIAPVEDGAEMCSGELGQYPYEPPQTHVIAATTAIPIVAATAPAAPLPPHRIGADDGRTSGHYRVDASNDIKVMADQDRMLKESLHAAMLNSADTDADETSSMYDLLDFPDKSHPSLTFV